MAGQGHNAELAKVRSDNMEALLKVDQAIIDNNPDCPPVSKRNAKLMATEKGDMVADNLLRVADVIQMEIDRRDLKHSVGVDLDDCDAVMSRSKEYFIACANAKHPPSILTYCSIGLGYTREHVSNYVRKHNNDTTNFIQRVFDLIADTISTGALYGSLDNIMAIFQLKNLHGFADNVRIEAALPEQAPQIDEDALAKEYERYAKENGIKLD